MTFDSAEDIADLNSLIQRTLERRVASINAQLTAFGVNLDEGQD